MIVKLRRRDRRYPDLTTKQPYLVIGIEAGDFRILNDQGRPFLYPEDIFTVVDDREPADWVTSVGEEGEIYAYARPLNEPGFFEDFFDGKPSSVATFWHVVNEYLAAPVTR